MSKLNLRPITNHILVDPIVKGETKEGALYIPDAANQAPQQEGLIVAVGPGARAEDGQVYPLSVKVGERILYAQYGAPSFKVGGRKLHLITEDGILGVID